MTSHRSEYEDAMLIALEEARAAFAQGDVPVGAVVVKDGEIIARRHNERELTKDPTAHAEILSIRDAAEKLGRWRLDDCTLIVTLEPCVMCAGALLSSRIGRLVYGAANPQAGATASLYNVLSDPRVGHNPPVEHGVCVEQSAELLKNFFGELRA